MTDTTLPEFERDWRARLVSLLVPESAPAAADVGINLTMDGNIEYEGEPDQSTALYLNVSVSGYDESGNRLWSYDREYEGAAAPMALLADMAKAKQPGTDMSKAPAPMTDATPDHLTLTRTDRGFAHLPEIPGTHGSSVRVYESSNAEAPHLWLAASERPMQLPVEEAVKLAEQILLLARDHYQGPTDCDQCAGTITEHESHCTRGR